MIDIVDFDIKEIILGFSRIYIFKDFNIALGGDDKKNRAIVENKEVDIFLSPEKSRKKDFMFYRDSGLNQVLLNLAYKNKIAIGFNFHDVLISDDRKSILGKMMQNVRLCRKYHVSMVIISGATNELETRAPKDLLSFGISLGMVPLEAKTALCFEKKRIK